MSNARKLTTTNLIPIERERFRIRTANGVAETWLKQPLLISSFSAKDEYGVILYK